MLDFARALPKLRDRVRATTSRKRTHLPRAGARLRRAAARPRLLPDRLRGLRRGERDLRAGDDAEAPRDGRGRHGRLRLRGQGRQAPRADGRRPDDRRGWSRRSRGAAGRGPRAARLPQRGAAGATSSSTEINDYIKEAIGEEPQRQGLPDLERDGARRGGARRLGAGAGPEHEGRARNRAKRDAVKQVARTTSATRRRSAGPPTSTRGSSTASTAASPSGGVLRSPSGGPRRLARDAEADREGRARPHRPA